MCVICVCAIVFYVYFFCKLKLAMHHVPLILVMIRDVKHTEFSAIRTGMIYQHITFLF